MRIPDGTNFGNAVATPQQAPSYNANQFGAQEGAAVTEVGDAGTQIADQMKLQEEQLAKTAAMGAYQDHVTNVKVAQQQANQDLASGKITAADYPGVLQKAAQTSFDSTIGALPDTTYKAAALNQSKRLDRATAISGQSVIFKYNQGQMRAQNENLLDRAGTDIQVDPTNIGATVSSTSAAYLANAQAAGIPLDLAQNKVRDWSEGQYTQHALNRVINARDQSDLAALDSVEEDLTDPKGLYVGQLSSAQRNQVLSTLVARRAQIQNRTDAAANAQLNAATTAYNKAVDYNNTGAYMSQEYQAQLRQAVAGTPYAADMESVIHANATTAGFNSKPLADQRAIVAQMEAEGTNPAVGSDPDREKQTKSLAAMAAANAEAYKTDPWDAAQARHVIDDVTPIDTSSLPGAVTTIQKRMSQIGTVENVAGTKISPLKPVEARQLLTTLTALSDEAKGQALQQIGAAVGDPARITALTDQWKGQDQDGHMSLSMIYGARGVNGGPLMTNNGIPVSTFILAGERAKQDGTVKIDGTADAGLRAQIARKIDGTLPPQEAEDAKQAAYLMAIGNAARNGRTAPDANIDVQTAIDTATGGISNTGGTPLSGHYDAYTVARPYGWSDTEFQNGVKAAGVANIENQIGGKPVDTVVANGHTIPATDFMSKFPSYRLQRVGIGGTYWVFAGQKFVTDKSGENLRVHLAKPTTGGSTAVTPTAPADSLGSAASGYPILSPM